MIDDPSNIGTNDGWRFSGIRHMRTGFIAFSMIIEWHGTANGEKAKTTYDNQSRVIVLDIQVSGIRAICRV